MNEIRHCQFKQMPSLQASREVWVHLTIACRQLTIACRQFGAWAAPRAIADPWRDQKNVFRGEICGIIALQTSFLLEKHGKSWI